MDFLTYLPAAIAACFFLPVGRSLVHDCITWNGGYGPWGLRWRWVSTTDSGAREYTDGLGNRCFILWPVD